jgi:hypothetical protein
MRAAFFVQVILVILIAAVSLTGRSSFAQLAAQGSAPAAAKGATDECLAKPGATAPQGSHWYYRINRADGRHCWYLGAEGAKVRARAREADQQARAPSPRLIPPAAESPAEPAVAETTVRETKSVVADATSEPAVTGFPPESGARNPTSMSSSDVEKPGATTDAEGEMPLIWPVLSPAEFTAAGPAPQSKVRWEYILAVIAGALALAAMLIGAIFNRAAARERNQDQAAAREQWQASPSVVPRLRIGARPQFEVRPQFADTLLAARRAEPVRNSIAAPRRDDGARWPLRPIELSSDPNHDVEASLQRLLHAWQRSAA